MDPAVAADVAALSAAAAARTRQQCDSRSRATRKQRRTKREL